MKIIPNQSYKIVGFSVGITPSYRQKLLSLGMLPGALIHIVRIAPLGDPIQIRIRNMNLMLRKKDIELMLLDIV